MILDALQCPSVALPRALAVEQQRESAANPGLEKRSDALSCDGSDSVDSVDSDYLKIYDVNMMYYLCIIYTACISEALSRAFPRPHYLALHYWALSSISILANHIVFLLRTEPTDFTLSCSLVLS